MSPEEAMKALHEGDRRYREALEGLIQPAKAAVNVLKDHGMHSTAGEIEAQLFAIESSEQELHGLIEKDPKPFFDTVLRGAR